MASTAAQLRLLLGPHTRPTRKGWWNFCHKKCGDKKFRLGLNFTAQRFKCYNCGASGLLKDLVPTLKGDITPLIDLPKAPAPPVHGLPWKPIPAEGALGPLATTAVKYLASRGVPREHAARLGLGFGTRSVWVGRVIHPFFDPRGALAGWQGRICYDPNPDEGDTTKKIRFATKRDVPEGITVQSPDDGALYLIDRVPTGSPILVVEGPYDAIHGERVTPTVALFGSRLTDEQARRILARRPTAIYLGLDRDKSGRVWNKDLERWEPDPRIAMARALYSRTDAPVFIVEYPASFEGDFGGRRDKSPHSTEELKALVSAARRFSPGG